MLRVVLDTVVFVRALLNPKSRCGRLFFEKVGDYELVVSPEIIKEVLEVIRRPEIMSKSSHFNEVNFQHVLACFGDADVIEPSEEIGVCRDPADDKFIECALAARAQYIVSEDNDLKAIKQFRGISVIDSTEFLRILDEQNPPESGTIR